MFLCDNSVIYYSWFDYSLTDACLLQALQKWSKRRTIFAYRSTRILISWQNIRKTWKEFGLSIKVHFYVWRTFRKWIFISFHTKIVRIGCMIYIKKYIFLNKDLQHFKLDLANVIQLEFTIVTSDRSSFYSDILVVLHEKNLHRQDMGSHKILLLGETLIAKW